MELEGKKALVTGGTSGIGREVARQLAALGAEVWLSGRDAARGAEAVAEIEGAGGRAHFVAADLADFEAIGKLAAEVGAVDILINNAGIFTFAPTPDETLDAYQAMFDVNVRAPFFLTAALAPGMAGRDGAIVNVSTMVAELGMAGSSAYAASKAALASLNRTWASEFADAGVRVNTVTVGPTETGGASSMSEEQVGFVRGLTKLGRSADPTEIAAAIVFLASPGASYITGANLAVDAGATTIMA
ncbi:MAG: SDR family oxidoreductase [Actinobacteria bacterium]|nr:SDR family oxidoreductase [Actinomycetota bacterium]